MLGNKNKTRRVVEHAKKAQYGPTRGEFNGPVIKTTKLYFAKLVIII